MLCKHTGVRTFLQMKSNKIKKQEKETPKRRRIFIKLLLVVIIIGALSHTYYNTFGFTIPDFQSDGITGKVITADVISGFGDIPLSSRIIIAGEWIFVLVIILYLLIKGRMTLERDLQKERGVSLERKKIQSSKSQYETDLDVLHDILKEKKILRLSVISKTFGITNKTTTDWCRILEEGDIATLSYPTVGSPKLTINTYIKEMEERKNKKHKKVKKDGEEE